MARAIAVSANARPHPNPRVGALVVSPDGTVLNERAHLAAGLIHAERAAIDDAGASARGATVVVTLEPCNHHGRTPPCTEALISAGVARVIVGAIDPDPRVAGSGVARLEAAGIEVITGVLASDVVANDPGYFHHRRTGLPRVTVKLAATLDGQVAAADGTSQWITTDESRQDVHRLRAAASAIAVGAGTLRADDPALTVRVDGFDGPQPRPVVVAGHQPLPEAAQLLGRDPLIYTNGETPGVPPGIESVALPGPAGVDLGAMVKDLGGRGVLDLLVEGGPTLAAGLARERLVDRFVFYLGAKLGLGLGRPLFDSAFSTLAAAHDVEIDEVATVGSDVRITALPRAPEVG